MKTIYKFPLPKATYEYGGMFLEMPKGAKILHVAEQAGAACIWAEVDTEAPVEKRIFYIAGTGRELPDTELTFIGTFFQGLYVWHLYEATDEVLRLDDGCPCRSCGATGMCAC